MALSPPGGRIRFNVFELDRSAGQLLKRGRPVKLAPQPFKLLLLLLDRHGQVVSRTEIQRHLWGESTFVDFDRGINFSINQIRAALGDDPEHPRYIETLPKLGYRFVGELAGDAETEVKPAHAFTRGPALSEPAEPAALEGHPVRSDESLRGSSGPLIPGSQPRRGLRARSARHHWGPMAGALLLAGIVWLATWARVGQGNSQPQPPPTAEAGPSMRVIPLTTLTGQERWPSFSPNGEQIAFAWDGEKQNNWDIYVTLVGSSEARRLTTDGLIDWYPTWSPDGQQIAFLRDQNVNDRSTVTSMGTSTIQVVSALGGPSGKLSDFEGADSLSWSPNGRWLAVGRAKQAAEQPAGIYLIPLDHGDTRLFMSATEGRKLWQPAFSPDGHRLAYVSCAGAQMLTMTPMPSGDCDLYVVDVDPLMHPTGSPRRLTTQRAVNVDGIAWTRDGRAVLYSALTNLSSSYLWRVGVEPARRPERLDIAGVPTGSPATTLARDRVAFTRESTDTDIYSVNAGHPPHLVVGSTAMEVQPRLSPDGRRLVFVSQRAPDDDDGADIWISEADGSTQRRLTRGPGRDQGSPFWSPDGRYIAFDSLGRDSQMHIWTVDADGGTPRRITRQAGNEHVPTWSRDGRWIYYSSVDDTTRDIWRVSASGGSSERLTHDGSGPFACESADGQNLLYQTQDADSPLMIMALTGGHTRQLVTCVNNSAFGVGSEGVYYVPCDASANPPVHVRDLNTGQDRLFGTLENLDYRPLGLSVSPDGRTIMYPRRTYENSDLKMIDNFR